jgi:Flp pilus assembly protein TadG
MKQPCEQTKASERGIIVLTFTLALVFLVLVVGLAIDGGMLYLTKVKLQSAGDAAALAAARSLNLSLQESQQVTDAQTAATNFFNANFPSGYLLSTSNAITTTLKYGTGTLANTLAITTIATTSAPTYFMRYFGYTTVPLSVTGTASRKDVNLILVTDISASMNNGATPSACSTMLADAQLFLKQFSNNRDTVGYVTFNDGTYSYAAVTNFNPSIINDVSGQSCTGDTNTPGGLHVAYQQLQALNNSTKLNVIVLFTDGQAESIAATFPIKSSIDTRNGDGIQYGNTGSVNTPSPYTNMPASGCSTTIPGVLSENAQDATGPDLAGITSGPWQITATGTGQGWNLAASIPSGCKANAYQGQGINGSSWNAAQQFRDDVAYIPATDYYGNSTTGFRTDYNFETTSFVTGQDEFPSTSPYSGHIRPDQPRTLYNASANAADNQGTTIRSNTTLNPMIITIGLGGNTGGVDGMPVDAELLMRLANFPGGTTPSGFTNYPVRTITNAIYSTSQAQGMYVYSPDASQLAIAFQQVASFVVELTH